MKSTEKLKKNYKKDGLNPTTTLTCDEFSIFDTTVNESDIVP